FHVRAICPARRIAARGSRSRRTRRCRQGARGLLVELIRNFFTPKQSMKYSLLRFLGVACLMACALGSVRAAEDTRIYELRTYTSPAGKLPNLLTRFRDHTLRLF